MRSMMLAACSLMSSRDMELPPETLRCWPVAAQALPRPVTQALPRPATQALPRAVKGDPLV